MTERLVRFVARELAAPVSHEVERVASALADRLDGSAVLFYGSALRTADLDGVLDFYVLTKRPAGSLLRRAGLRWLWPDVSYHEIPVAGRTIRAKVATMPLDTFEAAARGTMLDTTIWTRFVQPAALAWQADPAVARRVVRAVACAAVTAARFAAVLGPVRGPAPDYWAALFQETYRTELRVEPPGRERQILVHDPERYAALLPLALEAGGIAFATAGTELVPRIDFDQGRAIVEAWMKRARAGKTLNIMRLVKAAFTFDGAARYGLWKVHRHTGIKLPLTPWRERHPVLAAPGVLWRVFLAPAS